VTHAAPQRLELSRAPDGTIVLRGEIDMTTAPALRAALVGGPDGSGGALRIDLREVTYLDSAGLSLLYDHARNLHLIAAPNTAVATVLEIGGLVAAATVELLPPGA
jgi:anti-anti-sigma factor